MLYFKVSYDKFKVLTTYLFFSLCLQLYASYLAHSNENNIHLSHCYFIGQFVLLSVFFSKVLIKEEIKKFIYFILGVILLILGVYYMYYPATFSTFNLFEIVATSVPLIVYCFLFFLQKIDQGGKKYIYLISGLFLYVLCSTLLFATGNIGSRSNKLIIWILNGYLYLIYQLLIFIEWYVNFRKPSSISER